MAAPVARFAIVRLLQEAPLKKHKPDDEASGGRGCSKMTLHQSVIHQAINKLKTTPTPNKNGSYGIRWGVRMPYFGGPYAIISVEIP